MSLIGLFKPKGKSGFGYLSTAEEVTAGINLAGKTILITGCNSGLGLETARVLAMRGRPSSAQRAQKRKQMRRLPHLGRSIRALSANFLTLNRCAPALQP
jgi:hypothetical protein